MDGGRGVISTQQFIAYTAQYGPFDSGNELGPSLPSIFRSIRHGTDNSPLFRSVRNREVSITLVPLESGGVVASI